MPRRCLQRSQRRWRRSGDHDRVSGWRPGVAGAGPYRHEARLRRPGAPGAGAAQARSAQRAAFCFPRPSRRADQDSVARRPGPVPVRQAAGAWPLHLALCSGGRRHDHGGAARLSAGRHRLAHAAAHVASTGRGITARPIDSCCGLSAHCRRRCVSVAGMPRRSDSLPTTLAAARAAITAQREALAAAEKRAEAAEARAAAAENEAKSNALLIEKLKFTIAKLRHAQFGQSAERGAILEQLELQLASLEESASQAQTRADLVAAEATAAAKVNVVAFQRKRPARRPLPADLPRERLVHPAPRACPCCGGTTLRKIGEDVTEMLEHVPASWKVIQHVREKFSCRSCETIAQTPAPSHPIARGRAGPMLLAHILFCKYSLHLPLNRQSMTYVREGVDLDVSTLCDWVGAASATLMPLVDAIRTHVFAAERIHADDTPVKVLAKGKCRTGRLWTYVRDDRPFAGTAAPAAAFFYSSDRGGVHPDAHLATYAGLMQADAYAGFNRLYEAGRKGGPITAAMCWAHARRKFFDVARLNKAPIAIEAVARIDALFAIERDINGKPPPERQRVRAEHSRPLA